MGKVLLEMYEEAFKLGGINAQVRLAVLTSLASPKAKVAEDSPDNIKLFRQSMEVLRKEFSK